MADKQTKADSKQEIAALKPEDIRAAFTAGKLSSRRFGLITTTRKLNRDELREKVAGLAQVALWKRRSTRKYLRLSNAEAVQKHADKLAAIDERLEKARASINWERRREAEKSLVAWISTYLRDAPPSAHLLDYNPSPRLAEAVALMEQGICESAYNYHIRIARGFGKTTFAEAAVAYAVATGKRRFVVIVSAKADDAVQILEDIFGIFSAGDTFAQDYPDIALPLRILDGSYRRKVSYKGKRIALLKTHNKVVLPVLEMADGSPSPASGSIITARGFEGRVRGMKHGAARPDLLVLDDLQSDANAANEETVEKSVAKVRQTFLNLGGRSKLAVVMTSTPIFPDDLSEKFAADPAWRTTTFKAFDAWPTDWTEHGKEGLWGEYRRIYERELHTGDGSTNPRKAATDFYIRNREAMDKGAVVLDVNRFDATKQISAVQSLMDTFFDNGEESFEAEQQMKPRRRLFAFEITPRLILSRVAAGTRCGEIPAGTVFTCAATDINPSYAISTAIVTFKADRTAFVTAYALTPCRIDDRENDTLFHQQVYSVLVQHGQALHDLGIRLDCWGIDANGKQIAPVTALGERGRQLCGVRALPLIGRSGARWQDKPRTALYPALNDFVACADPIKGRRWFFWNADRYKEEAQKAWGTETGAPGGCTLFDGDVDHTDFALQVSNERLVSKRRMLDGRADYHWQTKEPHDFGDCLAMAYAMAGGLRNITGETAPSTFCAGIQDDSFVQVRQQRDEEGDALFPHGCVEI